MGLEFEAKLALAKELMAEELNIDLYDLTIVPQVMFHIDIEMFAGLDGKTLFLHDDSLALEALKGFSADDAVVNVLMKASKTQLKYFADVYKKTVSILERSGFAVKRLPGILQAPEIGNAYFMNGFFVPCFDGAHFLTNSTFQFRPLQKF